MDSYKHMGSYKGTDYGHGIVNIDIKTNIRYGVIPNHDVLQAWADESEGHYPYVCPYCEMDIESFDIDICPHCDEELDFQEMEASHFYYNQDGYHATQDRDDTDIFVMKSPFFTYAQFCSPCAPGACHLRNPITEKDDNNKCYCFGHDWFEGGKAPYPVYSVETGEAC